MAATIKVNESISGYSTSYTLDNEPTIYVYGVIGEESTGYTLEDLGQLTEVYVNKAKGVHCIETERHMFKVGRDGIAIVPVVGPADSEIVLSYDYSYIDGQSLSAADIAQLTDVYKLNIRDIMNGTGGLGSIY